MKKSIKILYTFLIISMGMFSCGEDGEDSAPGPEGPQGEQGIAGEKGDKGDQGETGTANVIYSEWIVENMSWIPNGSANFRGNQRILDEVLEIDGSQAVFLVYGKINPINNSFYALPVTFLVNSGSDYHYYYVIPGGEKANAEIYVVNDGSDQINPFSEFRYVIIPGGVPANGGRQLDYKSMSYEEIKALFNIPD